MTDVFCQCKEDDEVKTEMKFLAWIGEDENTELYICSICKRLITIKPWDTNPYQEAYVKFIKYVLENELPHEKSWTEATRIKEMMEFDGDWIE